MKQKCYKKERIRPLKTPRQVRQYIRRQAWYRSFKQLVWMEEDRTLRDKLRTLLGLNGVCTLVWAFDWSRTVQMYSGWWAANEAFTAWYAGK